MTVTLLQDGVTPLIIASFQGHQEVVRTLLEAGADVNSADNDGDTPLIVASRNGHQEVVRTLLQAGAFTKAGGGLTSLKSGARSLMRRLSATADKTTKRMATGLSSAKNRVETMIQRR